MRIEKKEYRVLNLDLSGVDVEIKLESGFFTVKANPLLVETITKVLTFSLPSWSLDRVSNEMLYCRYPENFTISYEDKYLEVLRIEYVCRID